MSMFFCRQCDELRDADDGCEEAPNGRDLICVECMGENEADADDERGDGAWIHDSDMASR